MPSMQESVAVVSVNTCLNPTVDKKKHELLKVEVVTIVVLM